MRFHKNRAIWRTSIRLAPPKSKTQEQSKSIFKDRLLFLVTALSLLGTMLTFIGYGVAVGVNIVFDIPHEVLFESPFELLELSVWAISAITIRIGDLSFYKLYSFYFYQLLVVAGVLFLVWCAAFMAIKFPRLREGCIKQTSGWRKKILKVPSESSTLLQMLIQGFFGVFVFLLTAPLIFIFSIYFICLLFVLMPVVSLIGVNAAEVHIKDYVVTPTHCQKISNRAMRLDMPKRTDEKIATCIRLSKDGEELARGREIFTTNSAVLLFNPNTGSVLRVPIKNVIVETIGTLDVPILSRKVKKNE